MGYHQFAVSRDPDGFEYTIVSTDKTATHKGRVFIDYHKYWVYNLLIIVMGNKSLIKTYLHVMTIEYVKLHEYIKKMHSRYFHALIALYLFEAIEEMRAPNIVGEQEAAANVKVINLYVNFFTISRHSLNFFFLIELAKMFDHADESLHINRVVRFAEAHRRKLTVEAFQEHNKDRPLIDELIKRYEEISDEDLAKIRKMLDDNQKLIKRLKTYRDKWLAHEDMNRKEIIISREEVFRLFDILKEILNLFSSKLDFSTTSYTHVEETCKDEVVQLFDYIKRFEPYRIKEIEDELDREMEKYKKL